jgi:hypothetical protein
MHEPTEYEAQQDAVANGPFKPTKHDGFTIVTYSYLKLVGVSLSPVSGPPRRAHRAILLYKGVPVHEGTRSDLLAVLNHAPTRQRWMDRVNGPVTA